MNEINTRPSPWTFKFDMNVRDGEHLQVHTCPNLFIKIFINSATDIHTRFGLPLIFTHLHSHTFVQTSKARAHDHSQSADNIYIVFSTVLQEFR
jgi:hypothetical protein